MKITVGKFVLYEHNYGPEWLYVDEITEDGTIWGMDADGGDWEVDTNNVWEVK